MNRVTKKSSDFRVQENMAAKRLSGWVRETKQDDVHQLFGYHGWVVPEYKIV